MAQQSPMGQGFMFTLKTHHTGHDFSGRVIRPTQRPLPDKTQYSQQTDIHSCGWIRSHNTNKRSAADPCLRPHDQGYS